jgi:hypothetical protein
MKTKLTGLAFVWTSTQAILLLLSAVTAWLSPPAAFAADDPHPVRTEKQTNNEIHRARFGRNVIGRTDAATTRGSVSTASNAGRRCRAFQWRKEICAAPPALLRSGKTRKFLHTPIW